MSGSCRASFRLTREKSLVSLRHELPRGGRLRSSGALKEDDAVLERLVGGGEDSRNERAAAGGAA
jgi:hypothetical protein